MISPPPPHVPSCAIEPMPTGRQLGAFKRAATLIGMPVGEYWRRRQSGEKRCATCRTWKTVVDFALSSKSWDGHCGECRECSVQSSLAARELRRRGIPAKARGVSLQRRQQRARIAANPNDTWVALYRAERSAKGDRFAPILADARAEYQRHLDAEEVGRRGGRPAKRRIA